MAQPLSEHDEDFGSLDDFAPEQPAVQPRHADFAPEQLAVDFAPEQLAVQPRHADLEPVALRPADTRRDAGDARSWFVGILVLLIVGGVWLGLRAIPPAAAPSEMTAEKIASSTVERQPIERPGIVPAVPSSSEPDRAVSVDRSALPVEKPRPAPVEKPRPAPVEKPRSAPVEKPRSAPVEKPRSAPVEKPRSAPVEAPRSAPVAGSPGKVVERPSPPPSPADASQVSPPMPRPATAPAPSPPLPVPTGEEVPSALVAAPEPAPASPPATTEPRSPGGASRSGGEDADRRRHPGSSWKVSHGLRRSGCCRRTAGVAVSESAIARESVSPVGRTGPLLFLLHHRRRRQACRSRLRRQQHVHPNSRESFATVRA